MRRALVIGPEATRHPFRASLPAHIRADAIAAAERDARRITSQDVKDFLLAYCTCFVAVTAFIA